MMYCSASHLDSCSMTFVGEMWQEIETRTMNVADVAEYIYRLGEEIILELK